MNNTKKFAVILYAIVVTALCLYVPWKIQIYYRGVNIQANKGYSFIFNIPRVATIDYTIVCVEAAIVVTWGIVAYLLFYRRP